MNGSEVGTGKHGLFREVAAMGRFSIRYLGCGHLNLHF